MASLQLVTTGCRIGSLCTLKTGGGLLVQLPIMAQPQARQKIDVSKLEGKDYAGACGLLYNPRELLCAMQGLPRDIAILIERGPEDEKQPKIFSATFHTFSECQECGEKHFLRLLRHADATGT